MAALRRRQHRDEPERRHRLRLPLQLQRRHRLDLDHLTHQLQRRRTDQHLTGLRRLLQPRSHVHRVPRSQPLLRPRHHLAGVHTDPAPNREFRQRIAHLDRRPAGPQRVVLMRRRHPEDRHHGIADELLHRAAVGLDDCLHPLEVAGEQDPQCLGIRLLAQCSRADQVAEENGDGLPLLPRGRLTESGAAVVAEARSGRVLTAATGAHGHTSKLEGLGARHNRASLGVGDAG